MVDVPRVVLLLSPHAGYDRGILQGIVRYSRACGPWNLYLAGVEPGLPLPEMEAVSGAPIQPLPGSGNSHPRRPLDLRQWGATGIIGRLQHRKTAATLLRSRIPVIAMDLSDEQLAGDYPLAGISEIRSDSYEAGRVAAEHLLERSFRHFGFCGYTGRTWSDRSRDGFCERIQPTGFRCDVYQSPKRNRPILWRQERTQVTNWLRSLPKPVGIMCCNDIRGRQVLEASALGEMSVPDDVAVVGVDDDQLLCELSNPPLSSVVLNTEQGGYQAAELLDALMSRRKRRPQRIDVKPLWVIPRQSTDVLAVDDPEVAAALRYIRRNFQTSIGVKDVVALAALSRRTLELRFEQALGRPIRAEIERARLAWVKRLLVETNLPVAKIAAQAGFSGHSYLSEVFRHEAGQTPAEYRKSHRTM
jgi:LacI family transcriptional regulator